MLQNSAVFLAYPRPAALLGVLWLGMRLSQDLGLNKPISLDNFQAVYLKAQQQGFLKPASHFEFERDRFPLPYSMGLEECFSLLDSISLVIFEDGELLFPQSISVVTLPVSAFASIDLGGVTQLWLENLRKIQLVFQC